MKKNKKSVYKRMISFLLPEKWLISLSVVFSMFSIILEKGSYWFSVTVIQVLFSDDSTSSFAVLDDIKGSAGNLLQKFDRFTTEFITNGTKTETLLKVCVMIMVMYTLKNVASYLRGLIISIINMRIANNLKKMIFTHIQSLSMKYFNTTSVGNINNMLTANIGLLNTSLLNTLQKAVVEPFNLIGTLALLLLISWKLTLFCFILFPFMAVFIHFTSQSIKRKVARLVEKSADILNVVVESIIGVKVIKSFGIEKRIVNRFNSEIDKYYNLSVRTTILGGTIGPIMEIASTVSAVVIIWFGGNLVFEGNMSSTNFLRFILLVFSIVKPLKVIGSINVDIQKGTSAGERIFELLDKEPAIQDSKDAIPMDDFKKEIHIENITFKYRPELDIVINKINISVKKGETVAFVGSSGSGKSTLMDLIPRFYDVLDGKIKMDGIDIKKIKKDSLRNLFGMVSQEVILFNGTIEENIVFGLQEIENYSQKDLLHSSKLANAHDFIMDFPEGYKTHIGERGKLLSGGQRQRLAIARAIMKNPPILMFDEATSSLDTESEFEVQTAINNLLVDRTVFVVAHRLSTIKHADKIYVFDKGQIIEEGSHSELIKNSGRYRELCEKQFMVNSDSKESK